MGPHLSLLFGPYICQRKFAAFAPRNVPGYKSGSSVALWFMLWKSVFSEKLWFLSMSYGHALVHVHHIMVREVSWVTSEENICLFPWNEQWPRGLQTHSHRHICTVSNMMSYNDEWGCDGLSLHSKFVHSVNNGLGCCPIFLFSCFSFSLSFFFFSLFIHLSPNRMF